MSLWRRLSGVLHSSALPQVARRWNHAHRVALPSGPIPEERRRCGALARKVGMTNVWDENGVRHPVTVLCVDRCHVLQVKEPQASDRRARWGIQVGAGPRRPFKTHKALRFHCAAAGVEPKEKIVEFMVREDHVVPVGHEIRADLFLPGQFVDVTGTSIGKGFQGPMKRWGFKGGSATHGNSKAHRSHGSTGQSTAPGRTFPGKKMAGRMGCDRVTVKNLRVLRIDAQRNLVYVRGAVPGFQGNWLRVRDAWKKKLPVPTADNAEADEADEMAKELKALGITEWKAPKLAEA